VAISSTRQSNLIKLENVWKIYQMGDAQVPALKGIDLEVRKGEFLAIAGISGSGKTTMSLK
jgi:putative ABC transport system ATP-binding protein